MRCWGAEGISVWIPAVGLGAQRWERGVQGDLRCKEGGEGGTELGEWGCREPGDWDVQSWGIEAQDWGAWNLETEVYGMELWDWDADRIGMQRGPRLGCTEPWDWGVWSSRSIEVYEDGELGCTELGD